MEDVAEVGRDAYNVIDVYFVRKTTYEVGCSENRQRFDVVLLRVLGFLTPRILLVVGILRSTRYGRT